MTEIPSRDDNATMACPVCEELFDGPGGNCPCCDEAIGANEADRRHRRPPPTAPMTIGPLACARPGCDNIIARRAGPGRPAIYCSPGCRPKRNRNTRGPKPGSDADQADTGAHRPRPDTPACQPTPGTVAVEIDNPDTSPDGRPASRVWTVRLRKDHRTVTVADGLGWPSAHALAHQLDDLLAADPTTKDTSTGAGLASTNRNHTTSYDSSLAGRPTHTTAAPGCHLPATPGLNKPLPPYADLTVGSGCPAAPPVAALPTSCPPTSGSRPAARTSRPSRVR